MKKRIIAALAAALLLISCLPFLSGCKAGVSYILNEDKHSYTIGISGFSSSFGGEFEIPEFYGEGEERFPVTAIANQGFASTGITKITIPASIEKIGVSAFMYCGALKEVVFEGESKIENILSGTFAFCEMLKSVNLPQTIKLIYPQAFINCKELKSIDLYEGLEIIGYRAFYNSGLERVVIPSTVEDKTEYETDENGEQKKDDSGNLITTTLMGIGYGAFHSCSNLKTAVVKARIETLYSGVFGYCTALESVYLPETLKKVDGILKAGSNFYGHAFHHDAALKTVYFEGTKEQWEAVEINNKEYKDSQVDTPYNNSALINAEKIYGETFKG